MSNFLTIMIIVLSILTILCILFQPSKSAGLSGSIAGGAEQLFGSKRSKGYETILFKATIVFSILLGVISIVKLIWF